MILSKSLKFLFIKTKKTAGTSLEIGLSSFLGASDIVTPISPEDEIIRITRGGLLPQNYSINPDAESLYQVAINSRKLEDIDNKRKMVMMYKLFYAHISANEVREKIDPQLWDDLFRFTIERHPYEKVISLAYFKYSKTKGDNFKNFLDEVIAKGDYSNYECYTFNDKLLVDHVLKYEDLPGCLARIEDKLGIKLQNNFPMTKHHYRSNSENAHNLLSNSQKKIIQKNCKREIELMGYNDL